MSYDESRIGGKIKSKKYTCPNCAKAGTDKDGYCVYCGELVHPQQQPAINWSVIIGLVNLALSCVILVLLLRNGAQTNVQQEKEPLPSSTEVVDSVSTESGANNAEESSELVDYKGTTYISYTVDNLISDYNSNAISAEEKYGSRNVCLKGVIKDITEDEFQLYTIGNSPQGSILCRNKGFWSHEDQLKGNHGLSLDQYNETIASLKKLQNGDIVNVYGNIQMNNAYFTIYVHGVESVK